MKGKEIFSIQPMREWHLYQVYEIEKRSFPSPWSYRMFRKLIKHRRSKFIVALKDGKVIGYAGLIFEFSRTHIVNLAVHPNYRMRRVGTELLQYMLQCAEMAKSSYVVLEVRVSNQSAQNLYKKFGFAPTAIYKGYYPKENEDAILMMKRMERGVEEKKKNQKKEKRGPLSASC